VAGVIFGALMNAVALNGLVHLVTPGSGGYRGWWV
jgi:hypothetical protein